MADETPIQMTRAEYEATYGAPPPTPAPVVDSAPIKMTRAEYEATYGAPPGAASSETSALGLISEIPGNMWGGIKKAPGAIYDMVTSIPSGVSNLAHLPVDAALIATDAAKMGYSELTGAPFSPVGGAEGWKGRYDRAERTLKGIAGISGAIAGGGTPLGPIVGSALGTMGVDTLNQTVGNEEQTAPKDDLKKLEENIAIGALLSSIFKGGQKIAKGAPNVANALDRKSIGTRQSDYGSTADLGTIVSPEGIPETFVKSSLDDLLEKGKLGKSRDPGALLKVIDSESKKLASDIASSIKAFDDSGAPVPSPDFANALQYIYDGRVPANEIPNYVKRLSALDDGIKSEGGGLSFLQQQKIAIGKNYSTVDAVKAGFEREIYKDLQSTIEKAVPEVASLNSELAKFITVKPIVNRSLKIAENASPLSKLGDLAFTTGGIGAPSIIGSILGGPTGALVGASAGLAGKVLKSPKGQSLIARVLRGSDTASSVLSAIDDPLIAITKSENLIDPSGPIDPKRTETASTTAISKKQQKPEATLIQDGKGLPASLNPTSTSGANQDFSFMNTMFKGDKMEKAPAAQVFEEIKKNPVDHAIMLMESDGDPNAKNPESSASGLFQLIRSTAKNLGVKDVFDPAENYAGYLKLKQDTIRQFGKDDVFTIYASHFLGAPTLKKWINGGELTPEQADQVQFLKSTLFPKLERIYAKITKPEVVEA